MSDPKPAPPSPPPPQTPPQTPQAPATVMPAPPIRINPSRDEAKGGPLPDLTTIARPTKRG